MAQPAQKSPPSPADLEEVQYLTNGRGHITSVLVPIEKWRDILSSLETLHLLKSDEMRRRLTEALQRDEGIAWEEALRQIGVNERELTGADLDEND